MDKKYQILITDDEQSNLKLITEYLEEISSEYELLLAPNGKIALEIAQFNSIDLLITDWEMDVMNGIELIQAFQADKRLRKIPIIMITGMYIESEYLYQALDEGAVDFLSKPVQKLELIARVKTALRLQESFNIIKEQKNKELAAKLLQIQEQNSILEEVKKQISDVLTGLHSLKDKVLIDNIHQLSETKKYLEKTIEKEYDWENFQQQLEQIHPEFLQNLKQYQDLNTHEIRFLTYLYLQISDKEIAAILNINYQSVRAYKSRLKKKLNIDSEISLNKWISEI